MSPFEVPTLDIIPSESPLFPTQAALRAIPRLPPIRLARPDGFRIDADTPCVLEMQLPIPLPHRLDPSLPAPPYHNDTIDPYVFRDFHAMPLLRRLMGQIVGHMFGPEHAVAAVEAPEGATASSDLRFLADFEANAVSDKENGFDPAAGYWRDRFGREGHGPIHAYHGDFHDRIIVFHAFKVYLVRGIRDAKMLKDMDPRVIKFVTMHEGGPWEDIVFEVGEHTEAVSRLCVIDGIAKGMAGGDVPTVLA